MKNKLTLIQYSNIPKELAASPSLVLLDENEYEQLNIESLKGAIIDPSQITDLA